MATVVDDKTGICFTVPADWAYRRNGVEWHIFNTQENKIGVFCVTVFPEKQERNDKKMWLRAFIETENHTMAGISITETEKFAYAETVDAVDGRNFCFCYWLFMIHNHIVVVRYFCAERFKGEEADIANAFISTISSIHIN